MTTSNSKITLVLGASTKENRFSYKAVKRLRAANVKVLAVGARKAIIDDVAIQDIIPATARIDTVTLYLSAKNQEPYLQQIIDMKPRRIIFNPGTENQELWNLAQQNGIQTLFDCTLVMLSQGRY